MAKKRILYRLFKQKHPSKKKEMSADGIYKDRGDRFFLGRLLKKVGLHPVAVVGEKRKKAIVVAVTHAPRSANSVGYPNPNPKDGRKAYLDRGVQVASEGSLYWDSRFSKYTHSPIDKGLDIEIRKWRNKKAATVPKDTSARCADDVAKKN